MNYKTSFLLLLCSLNLLYSQRKIFKIPDSLKHKSYSYLDDRIYELRGDSSSASVYLYSYLAKAKRENNWKEILNGYQSILHESPSKLRLIYADSMIYAAKISKQNDLIGSAYLSKGIAYYWKNDIQHALDNFITANQYISQTNDSYLIYKVKYNIANIKVYLGFYDEAISLLSETTAHFKNQDERPYLNSLHLLGLCYNRIGNYGHCTETNNLGIAESERLQKLEMKPYFIHSEGVNHFFENNYHIAIENLKEALKIIGKSTDSGTIAIANFYIGKSFWQLKKYDQAVGFFKNVDSIYNKTGYIDPYLRETYELLIKYYKTKNDLNAQLYSIDQLLKADNYLNESYKYLVTRIHKEYDTSELIHQKDEINAQFMREKQHVTMFIVAVVILFTTSFVLTYKYFRNRRFYKKKFDELMVQLNNDHSNISKNKTNKEPILDISPETAATILRQLEKFEKDRKFLEKDLTLSKIAGMFNSNPKYLSTIISYYREKTFSKYINDLKIDYLISLLKTDKKIRKYSNGALADIAGFSSTQRFAHAFLARTEMPTSFFIEEIKKNN
ncbi:AraC family transcriptional regulator [Flavobacterium sp. SORGH_AS_0622]|uniref:AraC family transcriptional regulator n=1 Tax=Flavobacterium sp. SORGH_AS_0622 TaxID=3041772 RepID=UPI0027806D18|nr:AraC family transcriptional regulator [Flavobacterium sp. SORGH_AS_0622]MDQ1164661.1 AraC-like DNA-binding protein/uncharacterized protein YoxC [Flavobacterium sp. SORGH_AS_0622]